MTLNKTTTVPKSVEAMFAPGVKVCGGFAKRYVQEQ